MALIKSALELAMEKTEGLDIDKKSIRKKEEYKQGNRLASAFLTNPELNLSSEWKKTDAEFLLEKKRGFLDAILSNLVLPNVQGLKNSTERKTIENALSSLFSGNKKITFIFQQIGQLITQYEQDIQNLRKNIEQHYGPKLRQKEKMIAAQTGQKIHLTFDNDPEFKKLLSQNLSQMVQQYQQVLDQAKAEIGSLLA